MASKQDAIDHLQILWTWLTVDPKYGVTLPLEYCNKAAQWIMDALDVLKEKPVKPSWRQGKAYCGACGIRLPMKRFKTKPYCSHCGRKVQWNETED